MWRFISAFTYTQALTLPHWHLFQDLQENKMFIFTAVIIQDSLVTKNNYLKKGKLHVNIQHNHRQQTAQCNNSV